MVVPASSGNGANSGAATVAEPVTTALVNLVLLVIYQLRRSNRDSHYRPHSSLKISK
jgi:hypothetical protein